jgi:hypothetical protein
MVENRCGTGKMSVLPIIKIEVKTNICIILNIPAEVNAYSIL